MRGSVNRCVVPLRLLAESPPPLRAWRQGREIVQTRWTTRLAGSLSQPPLQKPRIRRSDWCETPYCFHTNKRRLPIRPNLQGRRAVIDYAGTRWRAIIYSCLLSCRMARCSCDRASTPGLEMSHVRRRSKSEGRCDQGTKRANIQF